MITLVAEEITKYYGKKKCVDHLSFRLQESCVLGFIGPNGAGKTTSMRILCGIMPPSSGRVLLNGRDISLDSVESKMQMGYLPENAPLPSNMNLRSFLLYCGKMRCLAGKELKNAFDYAVESCHLSGVLSEELESLSKGFRRRACLAQAIMHQPGVLILDEPTDGLDPNQKREIRSLIRELSKKSAIIVSTHILEEIDAVCDRVLTICKGKKVFEGDVREYKELLPEKKSTLLRFLPGKLTAGELENLFRKQELCPLLSFTEWEGDGSFAALLAPGRNGETPESLLLPPLLEKGAILLEVEKGSATLEEVFADLTPDEEDGKEKK